MTRINNTYDPETYNIMMKAAQKLGVNELSDSDIKRTIAECKVGGIDLGIDRV